MTLRGLSLPDSEVEPPELDARAAVALVVGPDDHLLFIRRAERPGDPWSGDFAFPGGRHAAGDVSLRATAERETLEETGLDLAAAVLVGALPVQSSPLRAPHPRLGVFPFVYVVQEWPAFVLQAREVSAIHPISLPRLLAGEGRGEFRYQGYGVDVLTGCIRIDNAFIWGLTLRMLDRLFERIRG